MLVLSGTSPSQFLFNSHKAVLITIRLPSPCGAESPHLYDGNHPTTYSQGFKDAVHFLKTLFILLFFYYSLSFILLLVIDPRTLNMVGWSPSLNNAAALFYHLFVCDGVSLCGVGRP